MPAAPSPPASLGGPHFLNRRQQHGRNQHRRFASEVVDDLEGRTDAALRELRRAQLNPDLLATDEAWIRATGGDTGSAQALIAERRMAVDAGTRKWTALLIPAVSIGDRELAIRALEEMWKTREIELLHLNVDPRFDLVRSDVRFQNLIKRVFAGA